MANNLLIPFLSLVRYFSPLCDIVQYATQSEIRANQLFNHCSITVQSLFNHCSITVQSLFNRDQMVDQKYSHKEGSDDTSIARQVSYLANQAKTRTRPLIQIV